MNLIGYKGGHVERGFLKKLAIPSVDLEEFGCPKFEHLMASGFDPVEGCGFHVRPSHCAMVECEVLFSWLIKICGTKRDIKSPCNLAVWRAIYCTKGVM